MKKRRTVISAILIGCLAFLSGVRGKESDEVNVAANGGFENPEGADRHMPVSWRYYTTKRGIAEITSSTANTGKQSVRFKTQSEPNAVQGILQDVEVTPGARYSFLARVRSASHDPLRGSAHGQLVIEWKNEQGEEVGREWGGDWGKGISRLRWQQVSLSKVRAPDKAVGAVIGIHLFEGERGGKGSCLVDDVEMIQH